MIAGFTVPADRVAPHAGAWIETILKQIGITKVEVAPHAGAWIETGIGF